MVVTLIIETFNVHNNGTTISAMRFAEGLAQRNHHIRVVTCGNPACSGVDPKTGYEMFYVPELVVPLASWLAHRQNTLFCKPVRSTLMKAIDGADIVHIYQPWSLGSQARKIANHLNVPVLAAFHVQPENITYNIGLGWFRPAAHIAYFLFNLFFYRKFTHIHCPSAFIAAQLRSHGYKAWLHVISNGVHPMFCPADTPKTHKENELFRVLMIGRLSAEKRQDVLIKAVAQSKFAGKIQLYFAGSGPKEKKLKKMGQKLPLPPIFGYYSQPELLNLIRQCDLYVHASDVEIEGIACLEAMSCGLVPVISDSRRSATVQFALSQKNLFRSGNPKSLAERIDYWLEHDEERRQASLEYIAFARHYSLERSVQQIEHVYRTVPKCQKNPYHQSFLFRFFSRLFYTLIAAPLLFLFTRIFLGARIEGRNNIRNLKGALTLCNHVHYLDCALVGLAFFPRKVIFPTIEENLHSVWYGYLVKWLGGVPIPKNVTNLKLFLHEMEIRLIKGQVIHFYPEGDLCLYSPELRTFKRGAFYLASQARVPLVPMTVTYRETKGLRRLIRKKPDLTLKISQPIYPAALNNRDDMRIRMERAKEEMSRLLNQAAGT